MDKFRLDVPDTDLPEWRRVVDSFTHPQHEVNVAMVGKYVDLTESYKSLNESLAHAAILFTCGRFHIVRAALPEGWPVREGAVQAATYSLDLWGTGNRSPSDVLHAAQP